MPRRTPVGLPAFAAVVALVGGGATAATAPAPADLAAVLRPVLSAHADVPALFGAVVDHGRVTAVGGVGVRQVGSAVRVTADDLVHLGSDTKAMTAVAIGRLVQAHQLDWTDTMASLFPDVRADMDPAMAAVTVGDLLRHAAGLPHDLPWGWFAGPSVPRQRLAAVRLALSAKPQVPVGQYSYSNVGYVLLGAILERKLGQPWERVVTDRLFTPLGMTSAGFGPPGSAGKVDQPWGHHLVDGRLTPTQTDNPPVMAPAGEVHCTMADWGRFVAQFCRPPADPAVPLVDPPTLTALTTPAAGGTYAGGWLVTARPWAGGRVLTHAGSNTTWYCVAWVAPGRSFAVLAAANAGTDDAAKACDDVAAALIRDHNAARRQ